MAIETREHLSSITIRFSPHPSRGKVGTPLTWMTTKALETVDTDTGEQIGYVERPPVDLTKELCEQHFGTEMAEYLSGRDEDRAKATTAAAALQAEKDAHQAALQAKDTAHTAALQAKDDAAREAAEAHAAAMQAKDEQHAVALAALQSKLTEQDTYIAAVADLPTAKVIAEQKARDAKAAELAELKRKVAEMEAG